MANQEVDYVQLLKESFATGAKSENLVPLLVASLILALGSITIVLMPVLSYGLLKMVIRVTKGERVEIGEVWPGTDDAIKSFVLFLIQGIVAAIGFALLVVPGMIWMFLTCLAPFVMVTEGKSPVEAIKRSIEIVKNSWVVDIVGLLITMVVVGIGSIIPVAGPILVAPFAGLYLAKIYQRVHSLPAGAPSGQLQPGA
jgi:hypothetical protein